MFKSSTIDQEILDNANRIIREAYAILMSRQFFYYNIASQFASKAVDKRQCDTMGVGHVDGIHWLIYNPEFIQYYEPKELSAILEHEIRHFTDDHVKSFNSERTANPIFKDEKEAADHVRKNQEESYKHRLQNVAQDRALNVRIFGLPNIRMSISDIKREFVDKEGNFLEDKYEESTVKAFANTDRWFKDSNLELDKAKYQKGGELNVDKYGKALLKLLANLPDTTIVEASCITEPTFKKILKEADYEGTPALKKLRAEMNSIIEAVKEEQAKENPSDKVIDKLKEDYKDANKDFRDEQDVALQDIKRYEGWKYYYDLLLSCPKTEEALQNIKEMDVHFGDEDGEGEGGRDGQEARDRIMIEAAKNSKAKDIPGDLRQHLEQLFDKYNKDIALPWNVILRRLVNSSKKSTKENDVNSRNRYAPGRQILPGYKLNPIRDVAVVWDTSGSCMDEETQTRFINEANQMIKGGANLRVYYCDYDVEHVQDCKDKMMKPGKYEIHGGGGTDLDKGLKRAIEDGYRIIIQLSDNYMDFKLTKKDLKGRKIINVSTTSAKQPKHYGPQIHVNNKGN